MHRTLVTCVCVTCEMCITCDMLHPMDERSVPLRHARTQYQQINHNTNTLQNRVWDNAKQLKASSARMNTLSTVKYRDPIHTQIYIYIHTLRPHTSTSTPHAHSTAHYTYPGRGRAHTEHTPLHTYIHRIRPHSPPAHVLFYVSTLNPPHRTA